MLLNLTVQYVRHPHSSLLYILFLWWELRVLWGCNFWHYCLILGTQCYSQYTEEKLQLFKVNWTSQIKKEKSEKMSSSSAVAENIFTKKVINKYIQNCHIYVWYNPKRAGMLLYLHRASLKSWVNKGHLLWVDDKNSLKGERVTQSTWPLCTWSRHCSVDWRSPPIPLVLGFSALAHIAICAWNVISSHFPVLQDPLWSWFSIQK